VPRKSPLLRFGLVALALGVLLGACKVEADITVSVKNDGSGSINIVATADADIIKEVPDLAEDLNFDDLDAGWVISGPEKTSDGGLTVSLTHEFANPAEANKLLALLNGPQGPFKDLKLTRTGKSNKSTFGLSGTVEVNGGLSAFADAKVMEIIGDPPFSASLEFAGVDVGDALVENRTRFLNEVIDLGFRQEKVIDVGADLSAVEHLGPKNALGGGAGRTTGGEALEWFSKRDRRFGSAAPF
jgi:hypothetical protein